MLRIKNWSLWQTYRKDRGTPPWIKIYRNLLSNPEWVSLTDSEKGQLTSIWILAADKGGAIPDDPVVIQKMCMLDTAPNINKFIDLGFVDGQVVTTRSPDGNHFGKGSAVCDAPETETETETERETETETEREEKKPQRKRFVLPTLEQVYDYMVEKGLRNQTEAEKFMDYYTSNGWKVGGKGAMKDWKAAVRNWVKRVGEGYGKGRGNSKQDTRSLTERIKDTRTGW